MSEIEHSLDSILDRQHAPRSTCTIDHLLSSTGDRQGGRPNKEEEGARRCIRGGYSTIVLTAGSLPQDDHNSSSKVNEVVVEEDVEVEDVEVEDVEIEVDVEVEVDVNGEEESIASPESSNSPSTPTNVLLPNFNAIKS